jgi:sulfur-oxidizing protein SoxX
MTNRRPLISATASLVLTLALFTAKSSAQSAAAEGKAIAFDRSKGNCLSCHQIKGGDLPGSFGPSLADIKSRFPDRQELFSIIYDETRRNPLTVMPPFGRNLILTDHEINAIIDFLYTQ